MVARALYSSPFIPPEFIAAHGIAPARTLAASPVAGCHEGRCATAAGLERSAGDDDLLIVVGSCDQMRRSAEARTAPVFRFAMPATWETANAARIYRDELLRLSACLQRHGGHAPADLAGLLLAHDERRARLRAACGRLPPRAAAEALARYAASGEVPAVDAVPTAMDGRVPVALLGGPLPPEAFALHDLVEACGARIVLDGEGGERGLAAPCDRRLAASDPLAAIVDCYFLGIPDAFRRPDALLFAWLERGIAERGVRAVLLRPDPWCDHWRACAARIADWGRLPVVLIEDGAPARLATRIGALVEMLS
jgi:hypothetical protein